MSSPNVASIRVTHSYVHTQGPWAVGKILPAPVLLSTKQTSRLDSLPETGTVCFGIFRRDYVCLLIPQQSLFTWVHRQQYRSLHDSGPLLSTRVRNHRFSIPVLFKF